MLIKKTKDMTDSERIAVENSNNQYLRALSYVAVGSIFPYAGNTAPSTFLICDGSALDKTEYTDLFAIIGYTFGGSGDTFNIPDLRGKTLVGLNADDSDFDAVGKTAGEKVHKLSIDELPTHTHEIYRRNWNVVTATSSGLPSDENVAANGGSEMTESGSTGGGKEHNNMPPYTVCNYIIKAVNMFSDEINIKVEIKADQTYNAESENAQSGVAVAEAIKNSVDQTYDPTSENAQSGVAVAKAVKYRAPRLRLTNTGYITVPCVSREPACSFEGEDGNSYPSDDDYGNLIVDDDFYPKAGVSEMGGAIVARDSKGNLWTGEPVEDEDCVGLKHVNQHFVQQVENQEYSSFVYAKSCTNNEEQIYTDRTDGYMYDEEDGGALSGGDLKGFSGYIPRRQDNGNLLSGIPATKYEVANKMYVDALKAEIAELRAMVENLISQ